MWESEVVLAIVGERDPRVELATVQKAREFYRKLIDEKDEIMDSLQRSANAYRASVPADSVTGEGFRAFLGRDRRHRKSQRYLHQFAELFHALEDVARDAEGDSDDLRALRAEIADVFAPVGLSPEEFTEAIESGSGIETSGKGGPLRASDGLPRSTQRISGTPESGS